MIKLLVTYASKHGSTAEIAEAIAGELRASGVEADLIEVGEVLDVAQYAGVVLGSAVYMKRWRPKARRFLRQHAAELAERPFWVFSSGPVGDPAKDNLAWSEPRRTIAKAVALGAREHKVFGGVAQGAMAKNLPEEYRDRRDWNEIRAWAQSIAAELRVAALV